METRNNMTTKDKNKKDFDERMKEWKKKTDEINKRLKKKDYILTVYQTGERMLSHGDPARQVFPNMYYVVCSLEEIPEYIEYMKKPYWEHEDGLSKKEIKDYPYEKKKWGRNWNVVIEPLSEEMEKSYLSASKEGFFETWRMFHQEESDEVL